MMTRRYEPRWDLDRQLGEQAEAYVAEMFGWLCDGDNRLHVEAKHKRYDDDYFYVELMQCPRGGPWRQSGLNTTESELWAVSIADSGCVIFLPVPLLRAVIRADPMIGTAKSERDGDNPTEGRLLRLVNVLNYARQVWESQK